MSIFGKKDEKITGVCKEILTLINMMKGDDKRDKDI